MERPQQVLKTYFLVTTKEKSKTELKQTFLERTQRHFAKLVFSFRWDRHCFSEFLYGNHQNNCIQYKTTKTTFPKKPKAVFICIRYRKTSQTKDVKSQSTERSVRKLAQSKHDSAFEPETRIVSCREISAISQNSFFSYNQKKKSKQSSNRHFWNVLNVILESWCFSFGEIAHYFRKVCTKIIKTLAYNTKRRRPRFRKNQKLFLQVFGIARHLKRRM